MSEIDRYNHSEELEEARREQQDRRYRVVLCGANAYEKKYYFNHAFDKLPENIKEELNIICVEFTEDVGGIFTIGFTPSGELVMDTTSDEGDLLYDEIGSGLLIREIRAKKQELLQSLQIFYKVTFLHENPGDLIEGYDDEESDVEGSADRMGGTDGTDDNPDDVKTETVWKSE